MEHTIFFDGNQKKISWIIKTGHDTIEQFRKHADIYLDKVNDEQSKYIALHVGIFWGLGRFIIKNNDTVNVMIDSELMYDHLTGKAQSTDILIETRTNFLNQLVDQRKLKLQYHLINSKENKASVLLENHL